MPLDTIRTQLAAVEAGITGLNKIYSRAVDSIDVPPPVLINLYRGADKTTTPTMFRQRELVRRFDLVLLVALQTDLTESEKQLEPFEQRVVDLFDGLGAARTLNGAALTVELGDWDYGQVQLNREDPASKYLGFTFHLSVTERVAL